MAALGQTLEEKGFLKVQSFAAQNVTQLMKQQIEQIVQKWDEKQYTQFRTDQKQKDSQGNDDYFINSADKVRFFTEPAAIDKDTNKLNKPKQLALNKIGHALHTQPGVFRDYAQSQKLKSLVSELGWKKPDLVQSMYIFKQPQIGAEVTPHQDSTFLRTHPPTCLGLWLALHPATEENGCLWVRPGSHKEPLRRHFRRQADSSGRIRMVFDQLVDQDESEAVSWDGKSLQVDPATLGFVPVPVDAGDLIVIHGQLDHLSMPNTSPLPRHSFQLHIVDGHDAIWDRGNWLQYPPGKPFPQFE